MVLDHLTERFRQGAAHRKELLVVISHVLLGAAGIGCVQGKVGGVVLCTAHYVIIDIRTMHLYIYVHYNFAATSSFAFRVTPTPFLKLT